MMMGDSNGFGFGEWGVVVGVAAAVVETGDKSWGNATAAAAGTSDKGWDANTTGNASDKRNSKDTGFDDFGLFETADVWK